MVCVCVGLPRSSGGPSNSCRNGKELRQAQQWRLGGTLGLVKLAAMVGSGSDCGSPGDHSGNGGKLQCTCTGSTGVVGSGGGGSCGSLGDESWRKGGNRSFSRPGGRGQELCQTCRSAALLKLQEKSWSL
ncbi:UNVERIFIED_CONTAM: hypothetical protein K2H54_016822 [Gekko kuhli]